MSKKRKNNNKLHFLGMASEQVTGSMYLIEYGGKKILLECGLVQTNNVEKDFRTNSQNFKFKAKELDYVFVMHLHADHIGMIPKLVKEGFNGKIIFPSGSVDIASIMWKDTANIFNKDCEYLSKRWGKKVTPIYDVEDVYNTLNLIEEYDFGKYIDLDKNVSFKFSPSQHIINSAQLKLKLRDGNKRKSILYTSDLGNTKFGKSTYCNEFEACNKADIVIGETTYSNKNKSCNINDRNKDLEKLDSVINQFIIENKRRLVIPCFALQRTQVMLKQIYDLCSEKYKNYDFEVVIDSPMACQLTKLFDSLLNDEDKKEYKKILHWDKLRFVEEYTSSEKILYDFSKPRIILTTSGMITVGRIQNHLKAIISDDKSCILTCGYLPPNTIGWEIKNGNKLIEIDNKNYKNKCQIVSLKSFSSHMQYDELMEYYSNINYSEIYLVHGNNSRYKFCEELENNLRAKNKTSKVFVGFRNFSIEL